jgi:hypothetical protein
MQNTPQIRLARVQAKNYIERNFSYFSCTVVYILIIIAFEPYGHFASVDMSRTLKGSTC